MPCWEGLTPGKSTITDLESWIIEAGISSRTTRTDYETGTSFVARHANPFGALPVAADLVYISANHLVNSIAVHMPLQLPPIQEFQELIRLMGAPDLILVEPIPGDAVLGYAIRLIWDGYGWPPHGRASQLGKASDWRMLRHSEGSCPAA